LRSFVRQLSTIIHNEGAIQKRLKEYYYGIRFKASGPTIEDCKDLLLEFINSYPRTTLILDAFDECDKNDREELFLILEYFVAQASKPVKIFVSSRPDYDIKTIFKKGATGGNITRAEIEIEETDNRADIVAFVKSQIAKNTFWKNDMPSDLKNDIVKTLRVQSRGM